MMATDESSQNVSPSSLALSKPQPQNPNPVDYIGSFITLFSNYGLRYEGVLYHLNPNDKTLCLVNVICYGTEDRTINGFQIPPSNEVYSYIIFSTIQIMDVLVKPPTSLTSYGHHYGCLARRGAIISSKLYRPTILSPDYIPASYIQHGAKIGQQVPLISNAKFNITEATTDSDASSVKGSANDDGLQIPLNPLAQPQYPGSYYYDLSLNHVYQSMPCDALYQDCTNAALSSIASELVFAPQSFFTTSPPVPISLPPVIRGFDFKAVTKNFKQYELWGPQRDINQGDKTAYTVDESSYQNDTWGSQGNNTQEDQNDYTIDGSFYMISRKPFEPIGRPCNPLSPIEGPFSYLPSSYQLADLGFV